MQAYSTINQFGEEVTKRVSARASRVQRGACVARARGARGACSHAARALRVRGAGAERA